MRTSDGNSNTYKVCVLALSNLLLQALGFVYRIMLTRLAGTEALGLQSLVMQIYSIAVSVCISGMNVAVTAMAARLAGGGAGGIRRLTINAVRIYLGLFVMTALPVLLMRGVIAEKLIGDAASSGSLVLILICIFMTGIENILKSVHLGVGRVRPTAVSELSEQAARFVFVLLLLKHIGGTDSHKVFLIILGMVFSEFVSVGFLSVSHIKRFGGCRPDALPGLNGELTGILVPAAFTGIASTVFASSAALLLPGRLMLAGYTRSMALDTIGMLNSVAAPLVLLPMAFVGAVAAVTLPSISAAAAEGGSARLRTLTGKGMYAALSAALCVNFAFMPFLQHISYLIYGIVPRTEIFILLTLKTVVIYFQVVSTAVLNGLKKQRSVLGYTVLGEVTQLVLIYVLSASPRLHIYGYLISMSAGELLRLVLSLALIARTVGGLPLPIRECVPPVGIGVILHIYSLYAVRTSSLVNAELLPTLLHAASVCLLGIACAVLFGVLRAERGRGGSGAGG